MRAVPLQSVESKLGRTGESELAERETGNPPPPQLPLGFLSLRSISSLAWPSWETARSLRIVLSNGWITIQRISIRETNWVIHWIGINPVDSVIYPLNNWGQVSALLTAQPYITSTCLVATVAPKSFLGTFFRAVFKNWGVLPSWSLQPDSPGTALTVGGWLRPRRAKVVR